MSVMEAVMMLYAKEVATPDRVCAAVHRFRHNSQPSAPISSPPQDHEHALLLWINEAVSALRERVQQEVRSEVNIYWTFETFCKY